MPIFEPDHGRPRLVQPMQPLAGTFLGEVRTLLTEHLPAVVGEPLFPIRTRAALPDHVDVPEILALDVTGRPVVLEVAQVVDDGAIVDALRHAGAAARLTAADLARAYHPDPTRFATDYAAFRDQVPFARPAELRYGARLMLICSEVAAESADTLAAVRGPGWPVRVVQVGVLRGPDGRRLLDVSPLAEHEAARRSAEPTSLRLVQSAQPGSAGPVPVPLDDERPEPPFIPTQPPTIPGRWPVPAATAGRPAPRAGSMTSSAQSAAAYDRSPSPATRPSPSLANLMAAPGRHDPNPAPLSSRTGAHQLLGAGSESAPSAHPALSGPSAPPSAPPVLPGPPASSFTPSFPSPGIDSPYAPASFAFAAPGSPLPQLARVAAAVRAPASLVWVRVRRGQRLEATLRSDGLIQVADGTLFADPDLAAAHAAHSEGAVDGWRMWRLGDGGFSLAEVTGR